MKLVASGFMFQNSVLSGSRGVSVGDQLIAVDDCRVSSIESWARCVHELRRQSQRGYCLPVNILHQLDIAMNQQCMFCLPECLIVLARL